MEVYVIRHTKVAVPNGVCYGQANVKLANSFENEANDYAKKLPFNFDVVYSSPSNRCFKLAQKFSSNVILNEALLEMNFGKWEMQKWNDINQAELNIWMQDFVNTQPPNGENLQILYNRVVVFLNQLRDQDFNKLLIVAHAGVIRCIWAHILQMPLKNCFKIPVGFGEVLQFILCKNETEDTIILKN